MVRSATDSTDLRFMERIEVDIRIAPGSSTRYLSDCDLEIGDCFSLLIWYVGCSFFYSSEDLHSFLKEKLGSFLGSLKIRNIFFKLFLTFAIINRYPTSEIENTKDSAIVDLLSPDLFVKLMVIRYTVLHLRTRFRSLMVIVYIESRLTTSITPNLSTAVFYLLGIIFGSCLNFFSCGFTMTQGNWIEKSGGKKVEMVKTGLRITVPRFDNSELIASYSKTLIGRCMNPPKQDMKVLLFMFPRIWNVEGWLVWTLVRKVPV